MSNTVTNVEIEDVLESIRRLVSEDPIAMVEPQPAPQSRFVLTPALRVDEALPRLDPKPKDVLVLALPCEDAVPVDISPANDTQRPRLFGRDATNEPVPTDEKVDEAPDNQQEFSSRAATPLEDRVAELEIAVDKSREEWEPDGSETDGDEIPVRHIFASTRVTEHGEATSDVVSVFADSVPEQAEFSPRSDVSVDVSDTAENVHAAMMPEGAEEAISPPEPAQSDNSLSDDQLLDEEALRDMVADIVRQELQGSLGERITRNVRRMVRREIQRSMALKEFE